MKKSFSGKAEISSSTKIDIPNINSFIIQGARFRYQLEAERKKNQT